MNYREYELLGQAATVPIALTVAKWISAVVLGTASAAIGIAKLVQARKQREAALKVASLQAERARLQNEIAEIQAGIAEIQEIANERERTQQKTQTNTGIMAALAAGAVGLALFFSQ